MGKPNYNVQSRARGADVVKLITQTDWKAKYTAELMRRRNAEAKLEAIENARKLRSGK